MRLVGGDGVHDADDNGEHHAYKEENAGSPRVDLQDTQR